MLFAFTNLLYFLLFWNKRKIALIKQIIRKNRA